MVLAADEDTRRPSAPFITTARQEGPGEVQLVWDASRDNVGVAEYRILGNGRPLLTLDATADLFETFWFLDDLPHGNLWIQIQAIDAAGNESVRSAPSYVRVDNTRMRPPSNVDAIFDPRRQCMTVSFDPSPDERGVSRYVIRENLVVSGSVTVDDPSARDRITTETCSIGGSGWTAHVQIEAEGAVAERSVRTAPVAVYRHHHHAPTGFTAQVIGTTAVLTWDEPEPRMRAASFRILDALQPIADVPADSTGTTLELEPGRHWLQLATVNDEGGESRRTAPIAITIELDATGVVEGWVFHDQNGDGLQSAGERASPTHESA